MPASLKRSDKAVHLEGCGLYYNFSLPTTRKQNREITEVKTFISHR